MKFKYKKQILELMNLVDQFGYWSDEVLEYNKTLKYHIMRYINQIAQQYEKGTIKKEDIANG